MNDILALLNKPVFTFSEQPITLGEILFVPTVVIVGYFIARWLGGVLTRRLAARNVEADVIHLVRRIYYVAVIIVLGITVLDLLNVPITAFAFVSGAVAIGVGFGAQNIINNFISGWILMWERPIRIGDFLEVENDKGKVESINTRSTRIRRVDGVHMLIPNSKLLENTVVNWTLMDRLTRTSVRVGVAYGSPAKKVRDLIYQATREQSAVLDDPNPVVVFDDFGDNALQFEVSFWIEASVDRDLRVVRSDIRFRIDELFAENNIVISFPQRDVHIDGKLQLIHADDKPA